MILPVGSARRSTFPAALDGQVKPLKDAYDAGRAAGVPGIGPLTVEAAARDDGAEGDALDTNSVGRIGAFIDSEDKDPAIEVGFAPDDSVDKSRENFGSPASEVVIGRICGAFEVSDPDTDGTLGGVSLGRLKVAVDVQLCVCELLDPP